MLKAASPWLALLALSVLFVAPGVALHVHERPWILLQPCGDLLVLVAICVAAKRWKHGKWITRAAVLTGILLWIYLWDELIATAIVKGTPPLYDQLFLLRHLGVLVFDLWDWRLALAFLGGAAGLGGVVVLGRHLFRRVTTELASRSWRQTVPIGVALAVLLGAGTAADYALGHKRHHTVVQWVTPALAANIRESRRMYRALQRGIERSPYAEYEATYTLSRKPDVHLFLVESYGRILIADPEAGPRWQEQVSAIEHRLAAKGWHGVSAFSRAPIVGGRSWLAEATLLTGIVVQFEAVFQHLMRNIGQTPHLVAFLDSQGYETILLAPKDRPRPGVETINRYGYDRQVLALDLEYTGPQYGWGVIPDQYSLGYAHEHVWSKVDAPLFTNFHMVSSHAPWEAIPELVDDYRALNSGELPEGASEFELANPQEEFESRVRRYERKKPQYTYMGDADALRTEALSAAIAYDLELLARHIESLDGDKIVIMMGDHQPPLLSSEDNSYDVPIHLLSKDPTLLQPFRDQGFVDGLVLGDGRPTVLDHGGFFSLMVRALVICCTENSPRLPTYLREGVSLMKKKKRRKERR